MEVLITDKGLALLEELEPLVLRHEQLFAQNLSNEEIIQLNDLLEKFRTLNM
jgi:DNA-binding MarR family transcriptional regulator